MGVIDHRKVHLIIQFGTKTSQVATARNSSFTMFFISIIGPVGSTHWNPPIHNNIGVILFAFTPLAAGREPCFANTSADAALHCSVCSTAAHRVRNRDDAPPCVECKLLAGVHFYAAIWTARVNAMWMVVTRPTQHRQVAPEFGHDQQDCEDDSGRKKDKISKEWPSFESQT